MNAFDTEHVDPPRVLATESLWVALARTFDDRGDHELAVDARSAGTTADAPGLAFSVLRRAGYPEERVRALIARIPRSPARPVGVALMASGGRGAPDALARFADGELYASEAAALLRDCAARLREHDAGQLSLDLLDAAVEIERQVGCELRVSAHWNVSLATRTEFVRLLASLGRYDDADREIVTMFLEADPLDRADWMTPAPVQGADAAPVEDAVPAVVDGLLQLGRVELESGHADAAFVWFATARGLVDHIHSLPGGDAIDPGWTTALTEYHLAVLHRVRGHPDAARAAARTAHTAALLAGRPRLAAHAALLQATVIPETEHGGDAVVEAASRAIEQAGVAGDASTAASARMIRGLVRLGESQHTEALGDLLTALSELEHDARWAAAEQVARGAAEAATALGRIALADALAKRADSFGVRGLVPGTGAAPGAGWEWCSPLR